jgi:hypothetical protein
VLGVALRTNTNNTCVQKRLGICTLNMTTILDSIINIIEGGMLFVYFISLEKWASKKINYLRPIYLTHTKWFIGHVSLKWTPIWKASYTEKIVTIVFDFEYKVVWQCKFLQSCCSNIVLFKKWGAWIEFLISSIFILSSR